MSEALDFIMGAGVPACKFLDVGTTHVGTVLAYQKTQQTDFKTKTPKTFDNGDPMWQIVFTLQTEEQDDSVEDDDGKRKLYVKAGMLNAVREAIKKSGHTGDLVGGKLGVKYVRDGEAQNAGINPPKVYSAKYEPPTDELLADEEDDDLSKPF